MPKNIIKKLFHIGYNIDSYIIPVKKGLILFESSNGRNYSGNPRYIYEEIVKEGLDEEFKCIWSFENTNTKIPGKATKVRRSRFKFLYYTLRSEFWIFDSRHLYYLKKNKKTKYIQTWHGTPLKKLGLDMNKINMSGHDDIEEYKEEFKKNSYEWNYLISQNSYSSEIFKRCFDFKGEMLEIGYPRNDILINKNNKEYINMIKTKLNIPTDKKIILYAPTWRDNEYHEDGVYKFSTKMDFKYMEEKLSKEYILIVKYHYLVKDQIDWSKYSDFIIECNEKWDIQELYLISDILITDYSSVMFDYAILKRPMLFYTYDLEFYKNNVREFYFDIEEEVPGPIIENTEDLINTIKSLNKEEYTKNYKNKYNNFNKKYNEFDEGTASKSIIDLIKSLIY